MNAATLGWTPNEPITFVQILTGTSHALLLSMPPDGSEPFPVQAGQVELVNLARDLRESVPAPCRHARDFLRLLIEERRDHMRVVARAGRALFRALVPDPAHRQTFRRLLAERAGQPIRAVMGAAAMPWEALCLAEDLDTVAPEDFLGWNHVVLRETFGSSRVREGALRSASGLVGLGLVSDDALDSVVSGRNEAAVDVIRTHVDADTLRPLTGPSELAAFSGFFADPKRPRQLYQIDCHVDNPRRIATSHLRISTRMAVPIERFEKGSLTIINGPFVLLNACDGGTVSDDSIDGYAKRLREAGAHLVLAAEAEIGDDFAAEFTQTFYATAGGSTDVATALLMTRRAILAQ